MLYLYRSTEVERFFATFTPAISRKQNKGRGLASQLSATHVTSVSEAGNRTVYNLMTTMGNFFANGFLVDQCDTKETWKLDDAAFTDDWDDAMAHPEKWTSREERFLAHTLRKKFPAINWILLTGGEPSEQSLTPLVYALHEEGYSVALETSGTALGHLNANLDWVCVSPKINMPGGLAVLPGAIASADEIKFVIGRESDLDKIGDILQWPTKPDVTIALQPMSQSARATDLCIKTCLAKGWRLSIQMHKYINQP